VLFHDDFDMLEAEGAFDSGPSLKVPSVVTLCGKCTRALTSPCDAGPGSLLDMLGGSGERTRKKKKGIEVKECVRTDFERNDTKNRKKEKLREKQKRKSVEEREEGGKGKGAERAGGGGGLGRWKLSAREGSRERRKHGANNDKGPSAGSDVVGLKTNVNVVLGSKRP
jgi:hypothetical protein